MGADHPRLPLSHLAVVLSIRLRIVAALLSVSLTVTSALSAGGTARAQPGPASAERVNSEQLYQRGLDEYEHGDYALAATDLGNFLLSPPVGFDSEKLKRARLYRGISLFQMGDREGADKEFWQVLLMEPDFRPDPLFNEPAVIAAFDRIRLENAAELRKLGRGIPRRVELPQRDPLGIPLGGSGSSGPVNGVRRDFFPSIAPFGLAQFHNKQPGKAYAVLGMETSLMVANLSTFVALESLQKRGGGFNADELDDARLAKTVNNASFFLLLGALFYGSADGLWTATTRRDVKPASPSPVPQVGPGPGTAGATLQWRF